MAKMDGMSADFAALSTEVAKLTKAREEVAAANEALTRERNRAVEAERNLRTVLADCQIAAESLAGACPRL
jgi:outer membrane murein-binding lipoprotein Lpp